MTAPAVIVRERRRWDVILTVVVLVVYLCATALGSFASFFLVFASDSCGTSNVCDVGLISGAVILGAGGVWVVFVILTIVAIVLLVKKRLAFWVPILGILITIGIVALAVALAFAGVGTRA